MPIYEFRCQECEAIITKLCKMGETGETFVCQECGQTGLKRKISGFVSPGVEGGNNSCSPGCGGNCSGCH